MLRIIQISDTHVFADKKEKFLGINPWNTLEAVLQKVHALNEKNTPALTVLTGDLAQDHKEASYKQLAEMFVLLPKPVVWIPGNHDSIQNANKFFAAAKIKMQSEILLPNWQIIFLNSHWDNHVAGYIDHKQLIHLDQLLAKQKKDHVMLFVHHHLAPIGSLWIDQLMVKNASEVFEIIDKYNNVKLVACGHVHQESYTYHKNISCLSAPSTSVQFKPQPMHHKLDKKMHGFRCFNLEADGSFTTKIIRVSYKKEFVPDVTISKY